MREKLIELLANKLVWGVEYTAEPKRIENEELADYLIANDVVPVVRCKDCKHYEDHKRKVYENCVRNDRFIPMKPDDFCSCGERKDNDCN